jgi:hypothetical protein
MLSVHYRNQCNPNSPRHYKKAHQSNHLLQNKRLTDHIPSHLQRFDGHFLPLPVFLFHQSTTCTTR